MRAMIGEIDLVGLPGEVIEGQDHDRRPARRQHRLHRHRSGQLLGVPGIKPYGLGDVLELGGAQILEHQLGLRAEILVHPLGDRHAARRRVVLHPHREVDAAAEEVSPRHQHVGEHDAGADAEDFATRRPHAPLLDFALQRRRPLNRGDDALELRQQTIAHGLEDLAALAIDRAADQHLVDRPHEAQRLVFAVIDQPRIADDIERNDRNQFAIGLRHSPRRAP